VKVRENERKNECENRMFSSNSKNPNEKSTFFQIIFHANSGSILLRFFRAYSGEMFDVARMINAYKAILQACLRDLYFSAGGLQQSQNGRLYARVTTLANTYIFYYFFQSA